MYSEHVTHADKLLDLQLPGMVGTPRRVGDNAFFGRRCRICGRLVVARTCIQLMCWSGVCGCVSTKHTPNPMGARLQVSPQLRGSHCPALCTVFLQYTMYSNQTLLFPTIIHRTS